METSKIDDPQQALLISKTQPTVVSARVAMYPGRRRWLVRQCLAGAHGDFQKCDQVWEGLLESGKCTVNSAWRNQE